MAPQLKHAFTMRAYLSKENTVDLKAIKSGPSRIVVPVTHGFVRGSGLEAEILPGGADWILLDPTTSVCHLNVRTQARTKDGESIYVHYTGVMKIDEASSKVLAWGSDAKSTAYGDHHWFSAPIIETSCADHKWVETSTFVGQGRFVVEGSAQAVEYEIYRVDN